MKKYLGVILGLFLASCAGFQVTNFNPPASESCASEDQLAYTSYSAEGSGTMGDPYLIYTPAQLLSMQASGAEVDWDKHYQQMCDLDMEDGFMVPIGNNMTQFTGSYDGQNHSIENFNFVPSDPYYGVFGYISGASIENVHLKNVDIANFGYGIGDTGALVGACESSGSIEHVSVEDVTLNDDDFNSALGGMIGSMDSCTLNYAVGINIDLTTSYEAIGGLVGVAFDSDIRYAAVKGLMINSTDGDFYGGIVGVLFAGDLLDSYVQDATINVADAGVGGLVGISGDSSINRSYISTSSVQANDHVGGVVAGSGIKASMSVSNVFASSDVAVTATDGGEIVGDLLGVTINNSIYDTTTTCSMCDETQTGATGVAGISTLIDGTSAALASWDFASVWCLVSGAEPELRGIPGSLCGDSGTAM
ncbi:hypothetical protein MRY82_01260 [bacterium]|nr:hypothetical protein [bacterium]